MTTPAIAMITLLPVPELLAAWLAIELLPRRRNTVDEHDRERSLEASPLSPPAVLPPAYLAPSVPFSTRILSKPAYVLNRPPRRNPTSVMPNSLATSTARLLGAETAQTTGTPAVRHFCRISNELRPLTITTFSESGSVPSSSAHPTSLSVALCLPTSSRSACRSPSASKSAAACSPPVASKRPCASLSLAGNE